jgi:hypothetical protein
MPPPEKPEALSPVLGFNPHWFADPPPWWIYEVVDESQRTAVAAVQLQLIKATLTAQITAVEGLQRAIGQQG